MKIKRITCLNCNGQRWIYDHSDETACYSQQCPSCSGFGYIEVPMTNADWIRSMSDEELAHWLDNGGFDCNMCSIPARECRSNTCYKACLEWLKKPMED